MTIYSQFLILALLFSFSCSGGGKDYPVQSHTYKDLTFTELFRRSGGWVAGDGGYSIPIGDNKTLWTFGDSYIDSYDSATKTVPCLFQARNSAMIMDIDNPAIQYTLENSKSDPTLFNFGTDRKYWFWPSSGFMSDDTIYVFLSRLKSTGEPGMWGFTGVDSNYVGTICTSDLSTISYNVLSSKNGINFGISTIAKGRFTLIYGIKSNGFGNDLFLARFPTDNIYSSWQYFDGEGWTSELSKIRKIHSEFTSSFYICKFRNRYLLITTEFSVGCDQGRNIFIATSNRPGGPFTDQHSVWQVDDTLNGHFPFFYIANAHTEFENREKELLITYCINGYGDCVETCRNNRLNPDVYRPKAIRVPYSVIFNTD